MLNVQINNKIRLSPYYHDDISSHMDIAGITSEILLEPILQAGATVSLDGQTLSQDKLLGLINTALGDNVDPQYDISVKEFYDQTLQTFSKDAPLPLQELFAIQSGSTVNLPYPSNDVIYTSLTDVVPVCQRFLQNTCSYDELFATFAYFANPRALGFYFKNQNEFDLFKEFLRQKISSLLPQLDIVTTNMLNEFSKLDLNVLTQALLLRSSEDQAQNPLNFARIITHSLMQYTKQKDEKDFGVFPFKLNELICPKTLILINIQEHASNTSNNIASEWANITRATKRKLKVLNKNSLTKLQALEKQINKMQMGAKFKIDSDLSLVKNTKLRKSPPTTRDIAKLISMVFNKMSDVAKSQNAVRTTKLSFSRANRRNPDDFNKSGKIISNKYKPDIHIYLDTSGSVLEHHYQATIQMLIVVAKKLNINLYFNSFSHVLSPCSEIQVKDKSLAQIYKTFMGIKKVGGGTDYEQIWDYIIVSQKRKKELSIIITDFEYTAPNVRRPHPENLYYIPLDNLDWNHTSSDIKNFIESMKHIDPYVRKKVLL